MRRVAVVSLGIVCALGVSATSFQATPVAPPVVTKEVIAVYLGTIGTDGATAGAIRDMKPLLARQVAASGREFVSRGVSLEPVVEAGIQQLARLGPFDEISVGDNWTNSSVVRYLGPTIGSDRDSGIPQVILLEREVTREPSRLQISPEREIARFRGADEIDVWVKRGAPLPK
jgi:hypothetical protein